MEAFSFAAVVDPISRWYRENARSLPWREDPPDPYHVWLSEVMLQQTRIEAVIPYYDRFIRALPDVPALAGVEDNRLMKLWEGLGYYSRARNLKKAAVRIMDEHGGKLPAEYASLLSLPGFGEYTAGAVASIAFDLPVPAVDGNVLRVIARLTADHDDVLLPATRRRITRALGEVMPAVGSGVFNAALMELGERICLPGGNPRCSDCPLSGMCLGFSKGEQSLLPVRAPRKERRVERRTVLLVVTQEDTPRVLLSKRGPTGLLASLWEFPNYEGEYSYQAVMELAKKLGATVLSAEMAGEGRHLFTHVEWQMTGVVLKVRAFDPKGECVLATLPQVNEEYPLPTAFRPFTRMLPVLLEQKKR